MLTMTHFYVVISDSEIGPEGRSLLHTYRACGDVVDLSSDIFRITVPTAELQEKLYTAFKATQKVDFPNPDKMHYYLPQKE